MGPEEAEKKTENLFEFMQVRLPDLQVSWFLSPPSQPSEGMPMWGLQRPFTVTIL